MTSFLKKEVPNVMGIERATGRGVITEDFKCYNSHGEFFYSVTFESAKSVDLTEPQRFTQVRQSFVRDVSNVTCNI